MCAKNNAGETATGRKFRRRRQPDVGGHGRGGHLSYVAHFGPEQTNIAGVALKFRLSKAKWQHNLMTDLCIVCHAVSSKRNALNLRTLRARFAKKRNNKQVGKKCRHQVYFSFRGCHVYIYIICCRL